MKLGRLERLATISVTIASALAVGLAFTAFPVEEATVVAAVVVLASVFALGMFVGAVRLQEAGTRVLARNRSVHETRLAYAIVMAVANAAVLLITALLIRGGRIHMHVGGTTADGWLALLALSVSCFNGLLALALVLMYRNARPDGRQPSTRFSQAEDE